MARLPTANDMQRVIPRSTRPMSSISMDAASAPARALGQFGVVVNALGEDIEEKKEQHALASAENEFLRRRLQLEREIPEGETHYSQWGNQYQTTLQAARDEIASTLGSKAQEVFRVNTETDIIRGDDRIRTEARKSEISEGRARLGLSIDNNINAALGAQDPADREALLLGLNREIDTAVQMGYMTPEEAQLKKKEVGENYVKRRISMLPTDQRVEVLQAGKYGPNVDPAAETAMNTLQRMWGEELKIHSAFRDPEHNAKVGGAKNSQHTHGKAFDVNVAGMPIEERQELIRMARAAGFSGIGVYDNSIHFDTGPERAWGASYGRESLPDWATAAVVAPLGKVNAPSAMDTRLASLLPPDDRHLLLEAAKRDYDREIERAETQYAADFGDYVAAIRVGASIDPSMDDKFSDSAINQSIIDRETRELMIRTREEAMAFSENMSKLEFMSTREIIKASEEFKIEDVGSDVDAALSTQQAQDASAWQAAVEKTMKARAEDPAGYVASSPYVKNAAADVANNPSEYATRSLIEQNRLGIPAHQQRILSESMVDGYVREFSNMSLDEAVAKLGEFKNGWGKHGDRVVSEMMKRNTSTDPALAPELAVALRFADDPALTAEILSVAGLDDAELKKGIPQTELNDLETDFDAALEDYLVAFEAGDMSGEATAVFNMNRDVALKLAIKHRRNGMSPGDAVDRVTKRLFPETPINESQMKLVLPKEYQAGPVSRFLEDQMSVDSLRDQGVVPLDDPALPEFADLEVTLNAAESQGVWVNNSTGDGAVLMLDIDGFYLPVMVEKGHPEGPKERHMYEVKFANVVNTPVGRKFGDWFTR